jgi:hypothetical protein
VARLLYPHRLLVRTLRRPVATAAAALAIVDMDHTVGMLLLLPLGPTVFHRRRQLGYQGGADGYTLARVLLEVAWATNVIGGHDVFW